MRLALAEAAVGDPAAGEVTAGPEKMHARLVAAPFTITGSMMTAAISSLCRWKAALKRSRSFHPATTVSSSTLGGMPGELATGTGASAGPNSFNDGRALMKAWSLQP